MRNIFKGYKFFNIDPKKLRGGEFFKDVFEYRRHFVAEFSGSIKNLKNFKCFLCGAQNAEEFLAYGNYVLFDCRNCGLVSPNVDFALIDDKKAYDSKEAYENVKERIMATYDYRKATYAQERLDYIMAKTGLAESEINLLDVGCGPGYFISFLHDRGIRYKGLELAEFLIKICREKNLNVGQNDILSEQDETYTVATLFDVLEHLKDPVDVFKKLRPKLAPDGFVVAYTPNIHSFSFALMKENQNNLYPFAHIAFFDKKSLDYLAQKTGFKVLSVDYFGLDLADYFSWRSYEDNFDYLEKLKDFIPPAQAVLDKSKLSNHIRVIFKKDA